jgi:hypothetical protein
MTDPGQSFEELQRDLNPHRDADVRRAAETIVGQLHQKGLDVTADEDSDELASLLSAVERFESAVEARGGDSMINTPSARRPESRAFVVPKRHSDESLAAWADRVNDAAAALERGAGPAAPDTGGVARPDGGPG